MMQNIQFSTHFLYSSPSFPKHALTTKLTTQHDQHVGHSPIYYPIRAIQGSHTQGLGGGHHNRSNNYHTAGHHYITFKSINPITRYLAIKKCESHMTYDAKYTILNPFFIFTPFFPKACPNNQTYNTTRSACWTQFYILSNQAIQGSHTQGLGGGAPLQAK